MSNWYDFDDLDDDYNALEEHRLEEYEKRIEAYYKISENIPNSWLLKSIDLDEIESECWCNDGPERQMQDELYNLKSKRIEGDTLKVFSSSVADRAQLAGLKGLKGLKGFALVRNDEVIASIITEMRYR